MSDRPRPAQPYPVQPAVAPSMGEAQQLRAEIEHLRQLLARRDTLLAMQTQQNDALIAKLPNPRPTFAQRLHPLLVQLRLTAPR